MPLALGLDDYPRRLQPCGGENERPWCADSAAKRRRDHDSDLMRLGENFERNAIDTASSTSVRPITQAHITVEPHSGLNWFLGDPSERSEHSWGLLQVLAPIALGQARLSELISR